MTGTRLRQEGYMYVATFNQKERAEARAELHRRQGFDAKVATIRTPAGVETFSVYIKRGA
jgi:hypothetical protein